jgi:hypothetical protein
MLPVIIAVRIASGANRRNASRFGARESGAGCAWHEAQTA